MSFTPLAQGDIEPSIGYEVIFDTRNPDKLELTGTCTDNKGQPLLDNPVVLRTVYQADMPPDKPPVAATAMLRYSMLMEAMADFLNRGGDLKDIEQAVQDVGTFYVGTLQLPGYNFHSTCRDSDTDWPGNIFISEDGTKAIAIYRNHYVDGPSPVEEIINGEDDTGDSPEDIEAAVRTIASL